MKNRLHDRLPGNHRLFSSSLTILLIGAMLAGTACGGESGVQDTTDTQSGETTVNAETSPALTGRDAVSDDLPQKNYGGKNFNLLVRTAQAYEFAADEENGDLLNDAVFRRNRAVEERFGINLNTIQMDCLWGSQATDFGSKLMASIQAGDGIYDLVAGYAATIPSLASEGLFANWRDMEYNDFSKPWWSEDAVDQMTINGKDFMISGDLAVTLWDGMTCFYFNKKVAEDRKIGDLYSIVRDGEWTFDKLISITKDSYQDLDGDGEMSEGDAFGLILGSATTTDNFKEAFEIPVVKRGADGFPEYALKSEKLVDVLTRLNSYVHDAHDVYYVADLSRYNLEAVFKQGNSLFLTSQLGVTKRLRDMKDDFGIIPYPKYDEAQENYHSTSLDEFSMFVIPIDAPDKEMTSIITEALAAESYKKVIPTFYDIVLKAKTARDDESAEMIDIIRDGFTLDWGYVYSVTLGMPGHLLSVLVKSDNDNLVSEFDYYAPLYEENLNKVLKAYR